MKKTGKTGLGYNVLYENLSGVSDPMNLTPNFSEFRNPIVYETLAAMSASEHLNRDFVSIDDFGK